MSTQGDRTMGRLPRGPHGLEPAEVAADQRKRLIDAMVELVWELGYAATTVADVIERAKVSRKTFYAHFADRHELLLAAFDASSPVAFEEVREASQRTGGATRRLEALMRRLCGVAVESPGTIALATIEVAGANPAGLQRRDKLMSDFGSLIGECLSTEGDSGELSPTLARALAGSTHRTIDARMRSGGKSELKELGPELARWTRSYYPTPNDFTTSEPAGTMPVEESARLVGGRAPGTLTLAPSGYSPPAGRQTKGYLQQTNRERIFDAVAQLIDEGGYMTLTAQAIAERADISERAFLAHFKNKDEAFAAAVELGQMKALAVVERARAGARSWGEGVTRAVRAWLEFLASEPLFTRMAFVDAPLAGPAMTRRAHEHAVGYTRLLLDGAPQRRHPPAIAPEAAVQGMFELAFHHAIQHRAEQLLEMTREATYLVLAPFLGVSEAAEA
ncbi:MAG TPA: TetR/AcrR family transcriptional regulator [Solirubrobacteraceae bacterium]